MKIATLRLDNCELATLQMTLRMSFDKYEERSADCFGLSHGYGMTDDEHDYYARLTLEHLEQMRVLHALYERVLISRYPAGLRRSRSSRSQQRQRRPLTGNPHSPNPAPVAGPPSPGSTS